MPNFFNGMLPVFVKRSSNYLTLIIVLFALSAFAPNGYAQAQNEGDETSQPSKVTITTDADGIKLTPQVDLRMPVAGHISSVFGTHRRHHSHKGLDIAAERGTPIWAAAAGKVIYAGWVKGYGKTVLIEHADGRLTRYAHAASLLVENGDYVEMGQQIATVGSTGRSTGAHLHFEVIEEDGSHINPLFMLNPEPANSGNTASFVQNISAAYGADIE